ncbi:glutamate receptor ionotropic, delta-1-like [Centruroides sculpturatus]|uniref:glutamate receptor ionotropic, delta-1-like n=1 Tax=Centruroides sculpturatus TaxID=218467 RepID=UPI000C6EA508|nr:glutamate receptor ionotropic, delta-1-like [Centruroides sculpturatus]
MDKTQNKMTGRFRFRVFKAFQEKLKFSYSIAKPVDDYFGRLIKNRTWTEMIGKIIRQEVDMGIVPIFINYNLYSITEFSAGVGYQSIVFIVKKPEKIPNWSSIVAPFSFMIWIAIFITVIVFGLALHKVLERDFALQDIEVFWPEVKFSGICFEHSNFVYAGINLDGMKRFSPRFMIGIWWLSILILGSSYSGTLMSFMMYSVTKEIPNTFEQLANSILTGEYTCGVASTSILWQTIQNSKLKSAKIITNHIIQNNNFIELNKGIQRVQKERFALIYADYVLKKKLRNDIDNFIFSNDNLFTFMEVYAMRKSFPFRHQIYEITSRLFESGIIEKIDHAEQSRINRDSELRELSIKDIISPSLLLILGYFLSLLCFVIEKKYIKLVCRDFTTIKTGIEFLAVKAFNYVTYLHFRLDCGGGPANKNFTVTVMPQVCKRSTSSHANWWKQKTVNM